MGGASWVAASALLAAPWALLWPKGRAGYWWRLPTLLPVVAVPPLGVFGWGNPLTGAGILFPGLEWIGLVATLALMLSWCYAVAGGRGAMGVHMVFALFLALALVSGVQPPATAARGVDTRFSGVGLGHYDYLRV